MFENEHKSISGPTLHNGTSIEHQNNFECMKHGLNAEIGIQFQWRPVNPNIHGAQAIEPTKTTTRQFHTYSHSNDRIYKPTTKTTHWAFVSTILHNFCSQLLERVQRECACARERERENRQTPTKLKSDTKQMSFCFIGDGYRIFS